MLNEMQGSGQIRSRRDGREKVFWIRGADWSFLRGWSQPEGFPIWVDWASIFHLVGRAVVMLGHSDLAESPSSLQAIQLRAFLDEVLAISGIQRMATADGVGRSQSGLAGRAAGRDDPPTDARHGHRSPGSPRQSPATLDLPRGPAAADAMTSPLQIRLLSDGRAGHLNQSLGLAEAIGRKTPARIETIALPTGSPLSRIRALSQAARELPAPDLLVGAGHRTHLPIIWLCRQTKARTVVLMRPTLPAGMFDLCLVPRHDLARAEAPPNVIPTIGALNRVVAKPDTIRNGHLILIGGPSGQHGWDGETLADAIGDISSGADNTRWEITDSRRTPDGFLKSLENSAPILILHPHQQTGPDWLAGKLAAADTVWVTEDSVSMVCEALTAGARVGILPMPRKRRRSRVVRGLEMLAAEGFVTTLDQWRDSGRLATAPTRLAEADRAAAIVLERLLPNR